MEVFPFTIHEFQSAYPQRQSNVELGGGWVHTSKPNTPPARTITLMFKAMRYYLNDQGIVSDSMELITNLYALDLFYQRHELHKSFLYQHPLYGVLEVKFEKPFTTPKLIPNGNGVSEGFTIELREIPK